MSNVKSAKLMKEKNITNNNKNNNSNNNFKKTSSNRHYSSIAWKNNRKKEKGFVKRKKNINKMISSLISSIVVLVFGTLYPAYCSYKAVKSKNVREYVKWMMYWIVFALFTSAETFADIFISWLPFYYEVKVVFVIWLLSPYTKGSSFLYRKFVHPTLARRESEIDDMISKAKEQGYSAVLTLGSQSIRYATNLAVQAATRGPLMLDQFRRSYSTSDVTITELNDDGTPMYDNDMAMIRQRRSRGVLDSEEETENRVREDADYLETRQRASRPTHLRQKGPHNARRTSKDREKDRVNRLETWEEDALEAESIPAKPSTTFASSPSSSSLYSNTPSSPASPHDDQLQGLHHKYSDEPQTYHQPYPPRKEPSYGKMKRTTSTPSLTSVSLARIDSQIQALHKERELRRKGLRSNYYWLQNRPIPTSNIPQSNC